MFSQMTQQSESTEPSNTITTKSSAVSLACSWAFTKHNHIYYVAHRKEQYCFISTPQRKCNEVFTIHNLSLAHTLVATVRLTVYNLATYDECTAEHCLCNEISDLPQSLAANATKIIINKTMQHNAPLSRHQCRAPKESIKHLPLGLLSRERNHPFRFSLNCRTSPIRMRF